jgi:hypothetical protein
MSRKYRAPGTQIMDDTANQDPDKPNGIAL